jgi:hypothetical protein
MMIVLLIAFNLLCNTMTFLLIALVEWLKTKMRAEQAVSRVELWGIWALLTCVGIAPQLLGYEGSLQVLENQWLCDRRLQLGRWFFGIAMGFVSEWIAWLEQQLCTSDVSIRFLFRASRWRVVGVTIVASAFLILHRFGLEQNCPLIK